MVINGLQKLTLLDYPQHTACTIFTAGCNFRCPFCHNAGLVTHINSADQIPEDDLLDFLKKRVGLLDGVCITGGEPLLQPDIDEFMAKVKALGYKIKLDTNGSCPQKLEELIKDGLVDYIAMDIKNSKQKYPNTAGVHIDVQDVERSIDVIKNSGLDYEFRTTVAKGLHTPQDIVALAEWIAPAKKYFLQNFVDSGDLIGGGFAPFSEEELEEMKRGASEFVPNTQIRGV